MALPQALQQAGMFKGAPAQILDMPRGEDWQLAVQKPLLEQGMRGVQQGVAQPNQDYLQQLLGLGSMPGPRFQNLQEASQGFAPIAQQARTQFQQQTVPSLAERFTGGFGVPGASSAQRSSGFPQMLGAAGAGLEGDLAAQQAQYGLAAQQIGIGQEDLRQRFGLGQEQLRSGVLQYLLTFAQNDDRAGFDRAIQMLQIGMQPQYEKSFIGPESSEARKALSALAPHAGKAAMEYLSTLGQNVVSQGLPGTSTKTWGERLWGALKGAGAGAVTGMAVGPWGALAGGLAGGAVGAIG